MRAAEEYKKWLAYLELEGTEKLGLTSDNSQNRGHDLVEELLSIRNNEREIEERFGRELEFGTGGMRGIIGAGLNRMNIHTIRRVSQALARFVKLQGDESSRRGIVIGYDCRRMSYEFAVASGIVMAAEGVKAYVFPYLCPTPELSFTVRHLHAAAGVMITASHNPPEYNGYKVYGADGGQLLPEAANQVRNLMADSSSLFDVQTMALDDAIQNGRFEWVDKSIRETYVNRVVKDLKFANVSEEARGALRIVYTPLHGTGSVPVQQVLSLAGYEEVLYVPEQMEPDGEFPTVKSPNPEEPEALDIAIRLAKQTKADIVLGTDPDADRVGIAVRDAHGEYKLFTGNQVGSLLVDFVLSDLKHRNQLPDNGIVYKTIVTSELGREVAAAYGVKTFDTLTGFKYIGEQITQSEESGENTFLIGYEESYGYLLSKVVRDKDAVQTVLAIVEMAAYEQANGRTLIDKLEALFDKFGWHRETLMSATLPGADGMEQMNRIMAKLRDKPLTFAENDLTAVEDYVARKRTEFGHNGKESVTPLLLPTADVLKFFYEDGTWVAIRPSGTEPKLKAYIAVKGNDESECQNKITLFQSALEKAFGVNR